MKKTAFIFLLLLSAACYANVPTQGLKPVGSGTMSWLFWDLYNITLFSQTGNFEDKAYPQALSIRYMKNIDKDDLITATKDQWQHLGVNWDQQWLHQLSQLWPSVKANDNITLVVNAEGESLFYHNQKPLGGIRDKHFADAFTAIWLSPNTSEPKLRKRLINQE